MHDVHGGLLRTRGSRVDADVGREERPVGARVGALVRSDQPPRPLRADLAVDRLALAVGQVADAVPLLLRDLRQLLGEPLVEALAGALLGPGEAGLGDAERPLRRGVPSSRISS
ncbi:hypothetical protein GCM10025734_70930 [Kitasatospora paranensis]